MGVIVGISTAIPAVREARFQIDDANSKLSTMDNDYHTQQTMEGGLE